MVCSSCGRENDADARFCDACGEQLDARRERRRDAEGGHGRLHGRRRLDRARRAARSRVAAACDVALLRRDAGDARATRRHGREVHRRRDRGRVRRACRPRGRRAPRRAGGVRDARGSRARQRRARARVRGSHRDAHRRQHGRGDRRGRAPRIRSSRPATRSTSRRGSSRLRGRARCSSGEATLPPRRGCRRRRAGSAPSRRRARASRSPPGGCSGCGRTCRPSPARSPRPSSVATTSSASSAARSTPRCESRRAGSPRSSGRPGSASPASRESSCARSRSEARVVVGRCRRVRRGHHLPPARRGRARGRRGRPRAGARRRSWRTSSAGPIATRLIMGAIGANDEPGSPEETAWAFRRLFETLALSRPLVVVVDDIHWAEPTLLDLLEYVLGFSSGAPILLLCLARPDLFDARPSWAAPRPETTLVSLSPLSDDRVRGSGRRADGRGRRRSRGSAIASSTRPRATRCSSSRCSPCSPTIPTRRTTAVPATIQALLAARIDRLEPDERAVLQRASVEGRLFHRGARRGAPAVGTARMGSAASCSPSRARSCSDPTARSTRATTASASTTC